MKTVLFALAISLVSVAAAEAGYVNMSCAQAKSTYARTGRLYVQTGGTTVPIYGLKRSCKSNERRSPYWVSTTDNRQCVIGYRCYGGIGR